MRRTDRLFGLLVVTLGACAHTHRPWNAPGTIDVMTPPTRAEFGQVEPPGDPGERFTSITYGAFGGAGVVIDDGAVMRGHAGLELSLHRGDSDRSHYEDDFWVFPQRYEGINLGGSLEWDGDGNVRPGALYVELQRAKLFAGIAAGWMVDPGRLTTGPQLTLFFSDLYIRADYRFGEGPSVMFGMILKLSYSWVWSR